MPLNLSAAVGGVLKAFASTATLYRQATDAEHRDGSTPDAWPVQATGVQVYVEAVTVERATRRWGATTTGRFLGVTTEEAGIQEGDGLTITAGQYLGASFRVIARKPAGFGGPVELGLAPHPRGFAP